MRKPFSDGANSASHLVQGYLFGEKFFPFFLAYQIAQGRPNDFVDVVEYLAGWVLNGLCMSTATINSPRFPAGPTNGGRSRGPDVFHPGGEGWVDGEGGGTTEMD